MFGLGMQEILVIAVLGLLLFGPSQLPKMGKAIGETIKNLRESAKELTKGDD